MKLFLFGLLFPVFCIAQNDFEAVNGRIIWTHVFNQAVTLEEMDAYLSKEFPHYQSQVISDGSLSGNTDFSAVLIDRSGWPFYYNPPVRFSYTVEFKDNRYRVQVHSIVLRTVDEDDNGANIAGELFIDKKYVRTRDNTIRTNASTKNMLERLQNSFLIRFDYKAPDGW